MLTFYVVATCCKFSVQFLVCNAEVKIKVLLLSWSECCLLRTGPQTFVSLTRTNNIPSSKIPWNTNLKLHPLRGSLLSSNLFLVFVFVSSSFSVPVPVLIPYAIHPLCPPSIPISPLSDVKAARKQEAWTRNAIAFESHGGVSSTQNWQL